jgi:hypothetical protein
MSVLAICNSVTSVLAQHPYILVKETKSLILFKDIMIVTVEDRYVTIAASPYVAARPGMY